MIPRPERPYGRFSKGTHRSPRPEVQPLQPNWGPYNIIRKGRRPVDSEARKCKAHYSWDQIQRLASSIDYQIKNLLLLEEHPTCECERYLFHFNQECEQEYIQYFYDVGAQHQLKLRRPDLCELYLDQTLKMLRSWNKRKVEAPHLHGHHVEYSDGIMVWPRKDTLDQCALKVAGTLYAIESAPPSS